MTTAIGNSCNFEVGAPNYDPQSYRCHLAIIREDDGTFSVVILNLPGAGSCGDTEEEAVANAREAAAGIIESYLADGEKINWLDDSKYTIPEGAKQKWILVNV